MSILYIIAALLVIAAVISLVLSLLGIVVTGALKLLPGVFIVLAIIFFCAGRSHRCARPGRMEEALAAVCR